MADRVAIIHRGRLARVGTRGRARPEAASASRPSAGLDVEQPRPGPGCRRQRGAAWPLPDRTPRPRPAWWPRSAAGWPSGAPRSDELRSGASLEDTYTEVVGELAYETGPGATRPGRAVAGGPAMRALRAQIRAEIYMTLRRGETLLLTLGIPLLLLVFFSQVKIGTDRVSPSHRPGHPGHPGPGRDVDLDGLARDRHRASSAATACSSGSGRRRSAEAGCWRPRSSPSSPSRSSRRH